MAPAGPWLVTLVEERPAPACLRPAEPLGPETSRRSQRSVLYASRSCISLVLTGRFPRTRPLCTAHSCYWVVTLRLREGGGLSKVNTPTNGPPQGQLPSS